LLLFYWFLLISTTFSFLVGSLPSFQVHIGSMVSFYDIDPAHELGLGPEVDLGPDIFIDQNVSSSGALTHLTEFVLPTGMDTLFQNFEFLGIENNDDFMM
jgi:hypothetical protein